jgi:hypothetical protein
MGNGMTVSLYRMNGRTAVALHTQEDIYMRAPMSMRKDSRYFGHVKFGYEGRTRGIDVHVMDSKSFSKDQLYIKRIIYPDLHDEYSEIDARNNIGYEILSEFRDSQLEREIITAIRMDIKRFARNPAKIQISRGINYADKIIPVTKAKFINKNPLLEGGKQDYIDLCIFDGNLDFSSGCITGFLPGDNPKWDGETFTDYWSDVGAECEYCYALRNHKAFAKTLKIIEPKQLEEELLTGSFRKKDNQDLNNLNKIDKDIEEIDKEFKKDNQEQEPVKILRLGKSTEMGSIFTRPQLYTTLETCINTGTQCIMPTKMLEFDSEAAKLLKKSRSAVLFSMGPESVERGTIEYGCTDDWKMEQCLKYKEAGVVSALYLLTIEPGPYDKRQRAVMDFAKKHNVLVQLLPMDFPSKELAFELTGVPWDILKNKNGRPEEALLKHEVALAELMQGTYYQRGNGDIAPEILSEETQALVGKNTGHIGLCYHNSDMEACRGCFLRPGKIAAIKEKHLGHTLTKAMRSRWRRDHNSKDQSKFKFKK